MAIGRDTTTPGGGGGGGGGGKQRTLADVIGEQVQASIDGALRDSQDLLDRIAEKGGGAAATGIVGDIGSLTAIIKDAALAATLSVFGPFDSLAIAKSVEDAGGRLGSGYGLGYLLGQVGFQSLQPWLLPLFHLSNKLSQFGIFDPDTAAQLAARRIAGHDFAQSEAEGGGINDNRFGLMIQNASVWPALGEVLELRRRGEINPGDAHQALQRAGIPDDWIDHLLALERILLSPADLALGQLRGNITKGDAQDYARKLGVDADDLDLLTLNTGEPPGLEELLLAYRLGYIGDAELEHGILQSRVRNEWIPLVKQLRYRPPGTEAAIKAAVEHYITDDQARTFAQQNGLDPVHFDWLRKSWGEPISRTEAIELWNRGLLGQADVIQALRESRVKDQWIPAVLELKRRLIPIRQLGQIITHGIETPEWGIEALMAQGYVHDDAAALIGVETSGRAAVHKELAQGMITQAYEARAIGHGDAVADLQLLGWTQDQAEFILDLQDAKVALGEQHKAINAIRSQRIAKRLTEDQARQELATIGVLDKQAQILMADWNIEAQSRVAEPTSTDIANAAAQQALTWDDAIRALEDLGYTESGAAILLAANKVPLPKGYKIQVSTGLR